MAIIVSEPAFGPLAEYVRWKTKEMSKPLAIVWGLLTCVPHAMVVCFATTFFGDSGATPNEPFAHNPEFDNAMRFLWAANCLTIALTVTYIVYLVRTAHVRSDQKALWIVVLLLGNVVGVVPEVPLAVTGA